MYNHRSEIEYAVRSNETLEHLLDGSSYDTGELERIDRTATKIAKFVGVLTRMLISKGVISQEEAIDLFYEVQ